MTLYLTVARERRQPENDGFVAVISDGSPQLGHDKYMVLSVNVVPSMKAAKQWLRQMKDERPWETRQ